MLKLLHTSDWHLGVSAEQSPREEEHRAFLSWLLAQIAERQIDVLLHSGDAFHHGQPSAKSMRMYYEFLAACADQTSLRQVVVTGGNHDSPSRLEAPASLLKSLNIHVVGGLHADPASWERAVCPLRGASGEVEAVVLAVPYIHESRLGVQTAGMNPFEIKEALVEGFRVLYSSVADMAQAKYPGVPLIAMGHLTCYPEGLQEIEGGFHTPLHLVESLGSLPPQIFDPRYCYVALGHIHQPIDIAGSRAWYPGSPVPTDIVESRTPRTVLAVEVDPSRPDDAAAVEVIEVPTWRPIFELVGPPEQIMATLPQLEWSDDDLNPYMYVDFHVESPRPEAMLQLDEAIRQFDAARRPRVIRYKETRITEGLSLGELDLGQIPLSDMSPTEVFVKLFQLRHQVDPDQAMMAAFESLLSQDNS